MISVELPDGHVGIGDGSLKNDESMDKKRTPVFLEG